jgi:MFS family permease
LLRVAGGTSGILIGLYLARYNGGRLGAAFVGGLGAVSFTAELFASIPMGLAADAFAPRLLVTGGALAGAFAAVLFALARSPVIFFASRTLEGIAAAAIVPALLAYVADATENRRALRARSMSCFELTLLAGLALGGVLAAQLFHVIGSGAFFAVAVAYAVCAALLFTSVSAQTARRITNPLADLKEVVGLTSIRRLAPVWLCVNAIVGLWLGPTLPFLLTGRAAGTQYLAGIYAGEPARVGWLLLVYAIVFGTGVTLWSFVLPRVRLSNRAEGNAERDAAGVRGPVLAQPFRRRAAGVSLAGSITAVLIMIESGFTPAALAWLAESLPVASGRGAAMGIYSVLLSIGAITGSLLAGVLAQRYVVDGLLYGTIALASAGLVFLRWVPQSSNKGERG